MEGLGATLVSLIRNCSERNYLKFWFLVSDLNEKYKNSIVKLLEEESFLGAIEFIPFDAKKIFGHMHSLHGDWTAYGRLLIPSKVKTQNSKVLYLDADLIVNLDVSELFSKELNQPLGAVKGAEFKYILEKDFFLNELSVNESNYFFNSGVLLFNVKKWNELEMDIKVKEFGEKYGTNFRSADQTLLNGIFKGEYHFLDTKYNSPWYPNLNEYDPNEKIVHFVGSPKPWDYFGTKLHKGRNIFLEYTPKWWLNKYSRFSFEKLYRTYKIKNSIIRLIKNKIKRS